MPDDRDKRASQHSPDAQTLRNVAAEIEQTFPLVARHTGLVLFDVDPDHLQAQWQVEPGHLEQVRRVFPAGASEVRPQLRLLRLDAQGNRRQAAVLSPTIDAGEIDGTARFSVSDYGSTYQAELGLANGDGGWLLLVRSNQVQLPRPVGSPIPPRAGADVRPEPVNKPLSTVAASIGSRRDSLPEAEEAPRLEQEMYERPTGVRPPSPVDPTLSDNGIRLAPVFPLPIPRSGWSPSTELPRAIGVLDAVVPEIEAVPLPVSSRPVARPTQDAVSNPPEPNWLSAGLPPPNVPSLRRSEASEPGGLPVFPLFDPYRTISSSHLSTDTVSQPDVEIHGELLIYGRATPGISIRVFGQSLRVGANGRFSVRRVLDETQLAGEFAPPSPAGETGGPEPE